MLTFIELLPLLREALNKEFLVEAVRVYQGEEDLEEFAEETIEVVFGEKLRK